LLFLLIAFIVWRWTSVGRGMRQRDEKLLRLLDPVGEKLSDGKEVPLQEIESLASRPELRFMLFAMLRHMSRPDLLPSDHSSSASEGAAALAYWMMHPNEFGEAPEKIELVESLQRRLGGQDAQFHVYRFKMPNGHWAGDEDWHLGLAGPMPNTSEPYSQLAGAFSRVGDKEGGIIPSDLVDWYLGILRQKV